MEHDCSLQAQGLGASFGKRVILAEVDFSLPLRGVTALLGPAGSGKSTLLRTLADMHGVNPRFRRWGTVHYMGQAWLPGMPAPALVHQQARLMRATVLEALLERARPQLQLSASGLREWCAAQLEQLGFPELLEHLDTSAMQLSAVHQRAVAVLREALAKPALLMVDEPTAELPGYEAHALLELLRQIGQHTSVLMVTHHLEQASSVAEHMLLLAGGRVLEARSMESFTQAPLTEAGQQWLRTGSCAVASPGARREELEEGVDMPPPLPAAALAAIAEFADAAASPASALEQERPGPEVVEAASSAPADVPAQAPSAAPAALPIAAPVAAPVNKPALSVLMDWMPLQAAEAPVPASRGPRGFSWLVPGRLAGTPWPGVVHSMDEDLQALRRCGVTTLITLTENNLEQAPLLRHGMRNLHLPVYDREPPTVAQIQMLLARMSAMLKRGEVLAVHCLAGQGRTGTVLAAWLVREGLTAEEALRRVRLIDAQYVQSQAQEALLHTYEETLLQKMV